MYHLLLQTLKKTKGNITSDCLYFDMNEPQRKCNKAKVKDPFWKIVVLLGSTSSNLVSYQLQQYFWRSVKVFICVYLMFHSNNFCYQPVPLAACRDLMLSSRSPWDDVTGHCQGMESRYVSLLHYLLVSISWTMSAWYGLVNRLDSKPQHEHWAVVVRISRLGKSPSSWRPIPVTSYYS